MAQFQFCADDFFSTDTSVALIVAKTASPFLRFIRLTEPVVMIEVTGPAAVLMTISETTLSDMMFSTVPGKRFRMLVFIMGDVICASRKAWVIGSNEKEISHGTSLKTIRRECVSAKTRIALGKSRRSVANRKAGNKIDA